MSGDLSLEEFKAAVVGMILDRNPELAIKALCEHYKVDVTRLAVGVLEGRTRGVQAVYSASRKEILAANSEYLYDPFTIIREFYHHLRYHGMRHRGTEKHADKFAEGFIVAYTTVVARKIGERQRAE